MLIVKDDTIPVLSDTVDKDGLLYYTFYLKPPSWQPNLELIKGDVVRPLTPTGYYYIVTSSGITGTTEPVWATKRGKKTVDNTVEYKALDNISYLSSNATLSITPNPPSFSITDNIPLSNLTYDSDGKVEIQVGPVPSDIKEFTLTLEFYADTGHSTLEYDERSIIVKVGER
jgi:hypothetical protein